MFFKNRDDAAAKIDGEAGTRDHLLVLNGKEATPREYARIMAAQPHEHTKEEIQAAQEQNASRPFRLLR